MIRRPPRSTLFPYTPLSRPPTDPSRTVAPANGAPTSSIDPPYSSFSSTSLPGAKARPLSPEMPRCRALPDQCLQLSEHFQCHILRASTGAEAHDFQKSLATGHIQPSCIDRIGLRLSRCHLGDRKSTRLNSSHLVISYAVFC